MPGTLPDDVHQQLGWRLILGTDATVVRLLEAWFGEPIQTTGLKQSTRAAAEEDSGLDLIGEETILARETLLQGSRTGRNYLYAEATAILERLDPGLRDGLLSTSEPIGRLLVAGAVETFRELVATGHRPCGRLGTRFGLRPEDRLVSRRYRILMRGRPAILISEHFPPSLFATVPPATQPEAQAVVHGQ